MFRKAKMSSECSILAIDGNSYIHTTGAKTRAIRVQSRSVEGAETDFLIHESLEIEKIIDSIVSDGFYVQMSLITTYGDYGSRAKQEELCRGSQLHEDSLSADSVVYGKTVQRDVCIAVTMPLKKHGGEVTPLSIAHRDKSLDVSIETLLSGMIRAGFSCHEMSAAELYEMTYKTANPMEYDLLGQSPSQNSATIRLSLRKNLFSGDFLLNSNNDETVPPHIIKVHNGYIATIMIATLPDDPMPVSNALLTIDFPFTYNFFLFVPEQRTVIKELESARSQANIFKGKSEAGVSNNAKKLAIDDFFNAKASSEKAWKIVKMATTITLHHATLHGLEKQIAEIKLMLASGLSAASFVEWKDKSKVFASSIFGNLPLLPDWDFVSLPIASRLSPLRTSFTGDTQATPVSVFVNRFNSRVIFDPMNKRQNKWSLLVIGASGSGKSAMLNKILFDMQCVRPYVMIVDMATEPSYEALTGICGGDFFNVSASEKYRANLFDLRVGHNAPIGSKTTSLMMMLERMFSSGDASRVTGEIKSTLNRAVTRLYEKYFVESPKKIASVNVPDDISEIIIKDAPAFDYWLEYRDYYIKLIQDSLEGEDATGETLKSYMRKASLAQNMGTPILRDFLQVLGSDKGVCITEKDRDVADSLRRNMDVYSVGNMQVLFDGVTMLSGDRSFYTFYLGKIASADILSLLLLCYRDFFMRNCTFLTGEVPAFLSSMPEFKVKLSSMPKLVVYDEFHNLKGDNFVLQTIDRDIRQSRTLGMATVLSTQEIDDVTQSGRAFVSSSSNKIFTRVISQDSPSLDPVKKIVSALGLGAAEGEMLQALEMLPGVFADALFLQDDIGRGVVRYKQNSIMKWMSTTHTDERTIKDSLIEYLVTQKKMSLRDASVRVVSIMSKLYPDGTIGKRVDIQGIIDKL